MTIISRRKIKFKENNLINLTCSIFFSPAAGDLMRARSRSTSLISFAFWIFLATFMRLRMKWACRLFLIVSTLWKGPLSYAVHGYREILQTLRPFILVSSLRKCYLFPKISRPGYILCKYISRQANKIPPSPLKSVEILPCFLNLRTLELFIISIST